LFEKQIFNPARLQAPLDIRLDSSPEIKDDSDRRPCSAGLRPSEKWHVGAVFIGFAQVSMKLCCFDRRPESPEKQPSTRSSVIIRMVVERQRAASQVSDRYDEIPYHCARLPAADFDIEFEAVKKL